MKKRIISAVIAVPILIAVVWFGEPWVAIAVAILGILAAFEFYVLKEWPVEKVARHLAISINAVYIAKNRVLNQIRRVKQEMEEVW